MKSFFKGLMWIIIILIVLAGGFLTWFYMRYGGNGESFPNMSKRPIWPSDSLQVVAILPEPPGNIAVSQEGRIFCTYHAESRPDIKVWELVNDKPIPFPNRQWQSSDNGSVYLDAIFNIRIDAQNRLWTLDHGRYGFKTPRLLCFDINERTLVKQINLPSNIAGNGSYIQDMQIDTACEKIYISDMSALAQTPAIIIVEIATGICRRVLENHISLRPENNYKIVTKGKEMRPAGPLFHFHPGFDPIALDRKNEYLYIGPMSGKGMYRIKLTDLNNSSLNNAALSRKVELYADRGQSDGITMDNANNIYITDIENGSIAVIDSRKKYYHLVSHPDMRWPDGMSFGPDGYIYVADSNLPDVMMKSKSHMDRNAPYYIFKFKGLAKAAPGQ